jgi:hypothetical protein
VTKKVSKKKKFKIGDFFSREENFAKYFLFTFYFFASSKKFAPKKMIFFIDVAQQTIFFSMIVFLTY